MLDTVIAPLSDVIRSHGLDDRLGREAPRTEITPRIVVGRAPLTGGTIQVVQDRRFVSFLRCYPT